MNPEDLLNLPGVEKILPDENYVPPAGVEEEEEGQQPPQPQQEQQQQPQATEEQGSEVTQYSLEDLPEIDNPVGRFMDSAATSVIDFFDGSRDREEVQRDRDQLRLDQINQAQEISARINRADETNTLGYNDPKTGEYVPVLPTTPDGILRESTRLVAGGVAGVVEQPVRFAQQILGQEATFNLGIAENKTAVGEFARTTITMLGLMKGAARAGVRVGGGATAGSRIATEAARGAVADFIMEEGDGNLSNMLGDMAPGLKDTFLTALAHEEDDNIYIRKLKNMVEGGVFGTAVDGVGELYTALRAGKKARAAGATREEATQAVFDQLSLDLDVPTTKAEPTLTARDVAEEVSLGDMSRVDQLDAEGIRSLYDDFEIIGEFNSEAEFLRAADPKASMEATGKAFYPKELPNGTVVDWIATRVLPDDVVARPAEDVDTSFLSPEAQARLSESRETLSRTNAELQEQNIVRIDWDVEQTKAPVKVDPSDPEIRAAAQEDWDKAAPEQTWDQLTPEQQDAHIEYMRNDFEFGIEESAGLGNYGTKLYKQFGEVAKEQPPGTIIQAEAADDGFGAKGKSDAQQRAEDAGGADTNIRERLYQRSGLSEPNDAGIMYGIVKYRPNGRKILQPLDFTKPIQEQVDEALETARQYELNIDTTKFEPGVEARIAESRANNAQSVDTNLWEPNERAAKTTAPDMQDVLESQIKYEAEGRPANAAPKTYTTEETYKYFVANPNGEEAMASLIKAASQDVRLSDIVELAEEGNLNPRMLEGLDVLAEVVDDAGNVDLSRLKKVVSEGNVTSPEYMTIKGGIVTRALMLDTAQQLTDIATAARQVDEVSGDSFRQSEMLIDRLETLSKMDIEASYAAGSNLQGRQNLPANARQFMEMDGEAALKQKKSQEFITELREKLETGDPQAKAEFATMVDALRLADGDPTKVLNFWEKFRTVGGNVLKTTMFNGYLSSTTSQLRNLTGNAVNLALRPIAQSIGFGVTGNMTEARVALSAFHGLREMMGEAWKVAKISWDDSRVEGGSQVARYETAESTTRQVIQNMKASAETNGEKSAAVLAEVYFNLFSNPWVRMPTRGLSAVDDAVRTLVARMELKKEAMRNSIESGAGFRVNMDRYEKLVDLKIDGKGNILDQELLEKAKDVTFQRDLQGLAKDIEDLANKYPPMKAFLPFIKTPTNVLITTASYMPLWTKIPGSSRVPIVGQFAKEYRAAMQGNDESLKALYRGREALGLTTMIGASALASEGLLTGNGPRDAEKRKLWLRVNQPNSIKTPWGWVDYSTIEPLNTIFSMAADLTQLAQAGNDTLYENSWAQAAYTISSAITEKSYFKGISDINQLIQFDAPIWKKFAERQALGLTNNLILPNSGLRRQIGQLLAPGKQEFDDQFKRTYAEAIPGLRNVIGVNRIDILTGEEIGAESLNHVWNVFTPFDVANQDNPVAKELAELGVDINLEFSDKFKGVEMTASEKVMLQRYIAETNLGEALAREMAKPQFKKNVEMWRESGATLDPEPRWHRELNKILSRAKRRAKARMLRDNPTFAQKVRLNQRARDLTRVSRYDESQNALKTLEEIIDF